MASSTASVRTCDSPQDQHHITCPICNKEIVWDRMGRPGGRFTCSNSCQEELEKITGARTSTMCLLERARDPSVCVICNGPLDGVRWDKLYCSNRCSKRARARGLDTDKLLRARKAAIFGGKGHF